MTLIAVLLCPIRFEVVGEEAKWEEEEVIWSGFVYRQILIVVADVFVVVFVTEISNLSYFGPGKTRHILVLSYGCVVPSCVASRLYVDTGCDNS